jgi:hypothetical protein
LSPSVFTQRDLITFEVSLRAEGEAISHNISTNTFIEFLLAKDEIDSGCRPRNDMSILNKKG